MYGCVPPSSRPRRASHVCGWIYLPVAQGVSFRFFVSRKRLLFPGRSQRARAPTSLIHHRLVMNGSLFSLTSQLLTDAQHASHSNACDCSIKMRERKVHWHRCLWFRCTSPGEVPSRRKIRRMLKPINRLRLEHDHKKDKAENPSPPPFIIVNA